MLALSGQHRQVVAQAADLFRVVDGQVLDEQGDVVEIDHGARPHFENAADVAQLFQHGRLHGGGHRPLGVEGHLLMPAAYSTAPRRPQAFMAATRRAAMAE